MSHIINLNMMVYFFTYFVSNSDGHTFVGEKTEVLYDPNEIVRRTVELCNECGYTSIITIEPDRVKALKDTHQKETGHSKRVGY